MDRRIGGYGPTACPMSPIARSLLVPILLIIFFLASCTNIQPVAKIGLIAPFEGLYRRTGYEALAAMRLAIAELPTPGLGVLPLALDDSGDPTQARRSAEKLLVDPSVRAVVGPLWPSLAAATAATLSDADVKWVTPYAIAPDRGFDDPAAREWAVGLVASVAAAAREQGADRLVLAGDATGWPALTAAEWTAVAGMPVTYATADAGPGGLDARDAVFWLGTADAGASYVQGLRTVLPSVPFWLGPQGGDPVFAERAPQVGDIYWATWSTLDYNEWAATHAPSTPNAYLVYMATRDAINAVSGMAPQPSTPWQVVRFEIGNDGASRLYQAP